jgi:hypothetical protein
MNRAGVDAQVRGADFRGMTRVAGTRTPWCDIAEANRHAIGSGLDAVMARFGLRLAIAGDGEAVAAILRAARRAPQDAEAEVRRRGSARRVGDG